jgi:hypothetical protein
MTKTLSMVSHKNYNLNAKLRFLSFFDFQVNYMFYWRFHSEKGNPNQLLIYSMKVNIYIGFWTLKPKCTQYELCGRVTFKNAKVRPGSRNQLEGSGFFGAAPAHHSDACNAGRRYLESPSSCALGKWECPRQMRVLQVLWSRPTGSRPRGVKWPWIAYRPVCTLLPTFTPRIIGTPNVKVGLVLEK